LVDDEQDVEHPIEDDVVDDAEDVVDDLVNRDSEYEDEDGDQVQIPIV
jgi:hypothetical protein